MNFGALKLAIILFGLSWLLKFQAWRHPAFRARLKEKNLTAQFIARDEEIGRWFKFQDGRITSGIGVLKDADVTVAFKNAALGARLLTPPINWLDQINAQKEFALTVEGDDGLANWFAQTVMMGADGRAEVRHADAGRLDALLQHDQRRAGVRLRQGRQDRPHDADRFRRQRRRVLDHRRARHGSHAAAQDHARPARAELPSRSSIRPTVCSIR